MTLPPGFSLGQAGPPSQPISPFGFMGAGPIGMSMQQMMAQMQPNIPQIGGMLGPGAQQVMNFGFPLLQQFMMQRQLAAGMVPLGFGTGSPFQQMQAFNFMQTTNVALEQVRQRDMARIGAMPGGELAAGILGTPILGDMLRPLISRFLAPQGLEEDLTLGLLAATRGRVPGAQISAISERLFQGFSQAGPGGQRFFDPSRTGGLTGGQLGELAFEINRRGGGTLFNEQIAGDILSRQGGVSLGAIGSQARTGQIQGFQAEALRSRMGQVVDVLGVVDQMLGQGQPIARLLDIIQSISGKNITAAGADTTQLRRQFQQLGGLADVMGVAPQSVLAMAQAQAVNLRAQGLPGQMALGLTTQQLSMIGAAEANPITGPGFDVTRQQLARAAATGQAEAIQGIEGLRMGQFRALQQAGLGGRALRGFLGGDTATDQARRMGVLRDPGQTASLLQSLRGETSDVAMFDAIVSSEDMAGHLTVGDIAGAQVARGERGFETLRNMLAFRLGDPERAAGIVGRLQAGAGTGLDVTALGLVRRGFQQAEGVDPRAFVSVFNRGAIRRAGFFRRAGRVLGARATIVNQLAGSGGLQQLLSPGGFNIENIARIAAGGDVDLEQVLRRSAADPDADGRGLLSRFEAQMREALGLGVGEELEGREITPEERKKTADIVKQFSMDFARLSPEIVRGIAGDMPTEEARKLVTAANKTWAAMRKDVADQQGRDEFSHPRDKKEIGLGPLGELSTSIDKLVSGLSDLMGGAGGGREIVIRELVVNLPLFGRIKAAENVRLNIETGTVAPPVEATPTSVTPGAGL